MFIQKTIDPIDPIVLDQAFVRIHDLVGMPLIKTHLPHSIMKLDRKLGFVSIKQRLFGLQDRIQALLLEQTGHPLIFKFALRFVFYDLQLTASAPLGDGAWRDLARAAFFFKLE